MKVFSNFFEKNYEDNIPEPDWAFTFFKFLPDEMILIQNEKLKKFMSPFKYFLKGLQHEFGILKKQNFEKAYSYYERAFKLREPFSCMRLFFIHRKNSPEFFVNKNLDLAILYLLYACIYTEHSPKIFSIDAKYSMAVVLDTEDYDKTKLNSVIGGITNLEKDEIKFLNYTFNLLFPDNTAEATKCLENLEKLSEETNHPMVNLYLAEFYEDTPDELSALKNIEKSDNYFRKLSFCDHPHIQYRLGLRDAVRRYLEKSLKSFSKSLDFGYVFATHIYYNTHLDYTKTININNYKFYLKGIFNSILFGCVNTLFDFYSLIKLCKLNKFPGWERYYDYFNSFVLHNLNFQKIYSTHYLESTGKYVIPYFALRLNLYDDKAKYEELKKAVMNSSDILERHKYFVMCSLAKKEKNEEECRNWYLKYDELIKDSYSTNPIQCYMIYKYEKYLNINNKGKQCLKNVVSLFKNTNIFYTSGNFDVYYLYTRAKEKLKECGVKTSEIENTDEKLCVICLDQPKQAVFVPCAHKCCCKVCGEKIFETHKKCPVCKKEIVYCLTKIYD